MPVVSNTSPILNLAIIGRLTLMHDQFGEVIIPPAVQAELMLGSGLPGTALIEGALDAGWLHVQSLDRVELAQVLRRELDAGESEAIALAVELRVSTVLMDEHAGRAAAHSLGLTPIGILGVLLRAKQADTLSSVADAMRALRAEAGFFIAEPLYQQILRAAGEN
jgi:predicted nucleic acid-binding protein